MSNDKKTARALLYDSTSLNVSGTEANQGYMNSKSSGADTPDEKSSKIIPSEVEMEEANGDTTVDEKGSDESGQTDDVVTNTEGEMGEESLEQAPHAALTKKNVLIAASERYEEGSSALKKEKKRHLLIETDHAPSRWLLLRMVDAQEHLSRVTQRITSGMAVSQSDWEHTRRLTRKMGDTFSNEVAFSWEVKIDEEEVEEEEVPFVSEVLDMESTIYEESTATSEFGERAF